MSRHSACLTVYGRGLLVHRVRELGGPLLTRPRLKGFHGSARAAGSPATISRVRPACTTDHHSPLTTVCAEQRPQF